MQSATGFQSGLHTMHTMGFLRAWCRSWSAPLSVLDAMQCRRNGRQGHCEQRAIIAPQSSVQKGAAPSLPSRASTCLWAHTLFRAELSPAPARHRHTAIGRIRSKGFSFRGCSRIWVLAGALGMQCVSASFTPPCFRVGEAAHPGPEIQVPLGCSNPSGMRGKEVLLVDMPPGLWHISETQLSSVTQKSCKRELQRLGRQAGRQLRVAHGAAAPFRTNSSWAGGWTGVMSVADWPTIPLQVPWPQEHYASGRLLLSQHVLGTDALGGRNCLWVPLRPNVS